MDPGVLLFLAAVVVGVGYYFSLRINPFRNCPRCSGTGRRKGIVWTYAQSSCPACKGKGRQPRLGSQILLGKRDNN